MDPSHSPYPYSNLEWDTLPIQLRSLMPLEKHDTAQAKALIDLGFPTVAPVLPHLMTWLQDMNWPVAQVIAPFLAGIREPLLPQIRLVLQSADEIWIYWVLRTVAEKMPEDCVRALHPELEELAKRTSKEGVDVLARSLLHKTF